MPASNHSYELLSDCFERFEPRPQLHTSSSTTKLEPPSFITQVTDSSYTSVASSNAEWQDRSKSPRFKCDWRTLPLCLVVWAVLTTSTFVFAKTVHPPQDSQSPATTNSTSLTNLKNANIFVIVWAAMAATLNEALIDRLWRRIEAQALRGPISGNNLRAANFALTTAVQRAFQFKLSKREIAVLISYCCLRYGTPGSIALIQTGGMRGNLQTGSFQAWSDFIFVLLPMLAHIVFVVVALGFVALTPFSLLRNYDKAILLHRYEPYLRRVSGGSIAISDEVAAHLEGTLADVSKFHEPGRQVKNKFKGMAGGLCIICAVPLIQYGYLSFLAGTKFDNNTLSRFIFHYGVSILGTGYSLVQNFAIWMISLEGLCAGRNLKPLNGINRLGTTSGILLLIKMLWQGRPYKAKFLFFLFWSHSVVVRLSLFLWLYSATIWSIDPADPTTKWAGNPQQVLRIVAWYIPIVLSPFMFLLIVSFKAPIGKKDGWQWAKIAEGAVLGPGRYGMLEGKAAWGTSVTPFVAARLS